MLAQPCFGLRDAVLGQRNGSIHQEWIARGIAHVIGIGSIGGLLFAGCREMVAERAPGLWQVMLQRHRVAQRLYRFLPAPTTAQRNPQIKMHQGPVGLGPSQRLEDVKRACYIALRRPRCSQQAQGGRVTFGYIENLGELLYRQHGIAVQQACGVDKRLL